jgi:hypothetical protein
LAADARDVLLRHGAKQFTLLAALAQPSDVVEGVDEAKIRIFFVIIS